MNKLKKCTAMLLALLIAFSSLYILPSELFPKVMAAEIDAGETTAAYHYYDSYTYTYAEKEDGTLQLCYSDLSSDKEIESIVIPDEIDGLAVTELSANCLDFYSERRRVQTLSIGRNVRIINMEEQPFLKGTTISRIEVSEENPYFKSVDGVLFSKDGKKLICAPEFLQQEYTVPDGVEEIGDYAFYSCATIKKIVLSDSVCRIGRYALADQESYFNHDYWEDGSSANGNDGGYISIMGDSGVNSAFYTVYPLTEVVFGSGTEVIGEHAFDHSGITTLTFPAALKEIDITAFENCESLTDLQVSEQNSVFKSFDGALCSDGGATLLKAPACKQGTFTIPDTVTKVADNALKCCLGITELVLGAGVNSFSPDAFGKMEDYFNSTPPVFSAVSSFKVSAQNGSFTAEDGVLYTKDMSELVMFPAKKAGAYTFPASVAKVSENAFRDCELVTAITLTNNVNIPKGTLGACKGLTDIVIGDGVTEVGDSFKNIRISGLKTLTIGNGVKKIPDEAFSGCFYPSYSATSFTDRKLVIGSGVEEIGARSFSDCFVNEIEHR